MEIMAGIILLGAAALFVLWFISREVKTRNQLISAMRELSTKQEDFVEKLARTAYLIERGVTEERPPERTRAMRWGTKRIPTEEEWHWRSRSPLSSARLYEPSAHWRTLFERLCIAESTGKYFSAADHYLHVDERAFAGAPPWGTSFRFGWHGDEVSDQLLEETA